MQVTPRHGRFELSQIPIWWVVGVLAAVVVAGPFEGNDYPAQVYHTVFAEQLGEVFNLHWFSGHHVAGYGVLLAPVAAVLGIGVTGIVARSWRVGRSTNCWSGCRGGGSRRGGSAWARSSTC